MRWREAGHQGAWRLLVGLALAAMAACGGGGAGSGLGDGASHPGDAGRLDGGAPAEAGATPSGVLELGTGVTAFQPLPASGATLELTRGPQGGFHVYGAVRIRGVDPDHAMLRYTVRRRSDGEAMTLERNVLLRTARLVRDGQAWVRLGDLLIFDPDRYAAPADVAGTEVRVEATLTLPDGTRYVDGRDATLVDEDVMPPTR